MTGDNIFFRYWRAYGGFPALFTSVYFWCAILLTLLLYPSWTQPNWWSDVLSIMPSVLGFSLGGYAMWMAIGDDNFRKLISGEDVDGLPSPYMEVNAAFVHFILLQLISIITALIAKAFYFKLPDSHFIIDTLGQYFWPLCLAGYFISYFIFIYALLSAIAATLALFRVSSWYDANQTVERTTKEKKQNQH